MPRYSTVLTQTPPELIARALELLEAGLHVNEINELLGTNLNYNALYLRRRGDPLNAPTMPWTDGEVALLIEAVRSVAGEGATAGSARHRSPFRRIADHVGTRSPAQCRNKYYTLRRARPDLPVITRQLEVRAKAPVVDTPAQLFDDSARFTDADILVQPLAATIALDIDPASLLDVDDLPPLPGTL